LPERFDAASSVAVYLQDTRLDNGWLLAVLELATAASGSLKGLDNFQRFLVGNLTEYDVLAIEPAGDNGRDEKLRAIGVWSSICH